MHNSHERYISSQHIINIISRLRKNFVLNDLTYVFNWNRRCLSSFILLLAFVLIQSSICYAYAYANIVYMDIGHCVDIGVLFGRFSRESPLLVYLWIGLSIMMRNDSFWWNPMKNNVGNGMRFGVMNELSNFLVGVVNRSKTGCSIHLLSFGGLISVMFKS